ncbi:MAG: phage holin [Ruminococcus sp.]|nr:phage holin [Ruminococcus sp.]
MKINLKVRLKNPMFWVGILSTIVLTILAELGLQAQDITTWKALSDALLEAVKNPVIIVATITSVYNAIVDPTTKGFFDSSNALTYEKPKGE